MLLFCLMFPLITSHSGRETDDPDPHPMTRMLLLPKIVTALNSKIHYFNSAFTKPKNAKHFQHQIRTYSTQDFSITILMNERVGCGGEGGGCLFI